ncbi:NAD(P)H-hydrate epimerase [Branchiostoma belcheri]|nr:NAD(P)H-hydrate epimerase [Branchiostoma belcheri]
MFTFVLMVFSTKDRHVYLCVDSVQHQGQACSCVLKVFSTKDRHVHLCVDGVQHQGQAWASSPVTWQSLPPIRHSFLSAPFRARVVKRQVQGCVPFGVSRGRFCVQNPGCGVKIRRVEFRGPGKGVGPGTYGKRFGDMESWKGKYASGLRFSFRKRYSTEKGGTVDEDCEVISMGHKIGDISYVR